MNISPFPEEDDVIAVAQVKVVLTTLSGDEHPVEMSMVAFQGNDRPGLVAYGETEKKAVVELFNRLVDEEDPDD